jgi:O-methyltransferase
LKKAMGLEYARRRELQALLEAEGYGVIPNDQFRIDMEPEFRTLWNEIREFTMTGMERGYGLCQAVRYIEARELRGDFVECGVWKGGSCMLMMRTLQQLGRERRVWLYDTFSGMPDPGEEDIIAWNRRPVREKREEELKEGKDSFAHWAVGLSRVRANIALTGYPDELTRYVPGDVAETVLKEAPKRIALLRLDTDWYASTLAELERLYPLLEEGGVLIIDDYGHFEGARRAVDEYFARPDVRPILFSRLDYTGRMGIK